LLGRVRVKYILVVYMYEMLRTHCKELVKLNHVVWFVRLELRYKLTRCSMNLVCIWIYVYLPRVFWCEEMGFIERNEYGGRKWMSVI
jgi:hypothetical protein